MGTPTKHAKCQIQHREKTANVLLLPGIKNPRLSQIYTGDIVSSTKGQNSSQLIGGINLEVTANIFRLSSATDKYIFGKRTYNCMCSFYNL